MTTDAPLLTKQAILARAKNAGVPGDTLLKLLARHQLLARIEAANPGNFMLKGGHALVARGVTHRATRDIDVRADAKSAKAAAAALIRAAHTNIGDGIMFEPDGEPARLVAADTGGYSGMAVRLAATLGGDFMANVKVDVVTAREPIGRPERIDVPPPAAFDGLASLSLYVYPVEDHIADKLCATHQSYGADRTASTRVHDLYDLCAIAASSIADAATLLSAIRAEEDRRGLTPAAHLDIPREWSGRWRTIRTSAAAERHIPAGYREAVAQAKRLIDPILSGEVTAGTWDPALQAWS